MSELLKDLAIKRIENFRLSCHEIGIDVDEEIDALIQAVKVGPRLTSNLNPVDPWIEQGLKTAFVRLAVSPH